MPGVVFQTKPVPVGLSCKLFPSNHGQALQAEGFCVLALWIAGEPLGRALQTHTTFYSEPIQNLGQVSQESFPGEGQRSLLGRGVQGQNNTSNSRKPIPRSSKLQTLFVLAPDGSSASPARSLDLQGQTST